MTENGKETGMIGFSGNEEVFIKISVLYMSKYEILVNFSITTSG